jgi:hypothetical protein
VTTPTSPAARWWRWLTALGVLLLVGATALSSTTSDAWWIRALDFPRQQLAAVLAILLVATVRWWRRGRWPLRLLWLAGAGALVTQLVWIAPYTGLVDVDMAVADACTPEARVRILVANVR